jgi:thioredoxin-like negative regulator of GroEL
MNKINRLACLLCCASVLLLTGCATRPASPDKTTQQPLKSAVLRPEDQALFKQGQQWIAQKNWTAALPAWQTLQKNNPGHWPSRINLAAIYCQQLQWAAAKSLLDGLPSGHTDPHANNLLGLLAEQDGRFIEAEQFYSRATQGADAPAEAFYNLALLYDKYWQDPSRALPLYKAYATRRPEDTAVAQWITELQQKVKP